MLSGATFKAAAIAGTAVFRIVVSSDSMKKATATSQGSNFKLDDSIRGVTAISGTGARFKANMHAHGPKHGKLPGSIQKISR
jgi:hypothetical protein